MLIKLLENRFNFVFYFLITLCNNTLGGELPAASYIQHIAVDYSDSNTLYAATMGAGLYKSTNAAAQWEEISPMTECDAYHVIRIDPKEPELIFAGGKESGVWLSPDKGVSWKFLGLKGKSIADLAIDPENSNRIFVLASDGVYRNTDINNSLWEQVFNYTKFVENTMKEQALNRSWTYSRFQKIAINPHNPSIIYIGARWEGGYHFSTDGGQTWQHRWISGIFRRTDPIIFHPQNPDIIYIGTHHQGLFKSYNSGKSWVAMSRGLEPQIRTPFYGAYLLSGLAIDPSNPETLYSGSDYSNWKTTDGGLKWEELGKTLTYEFARSFAVDPQHSNIIYAGTSVGIYKSIDAGKNWFSANKGFPELDIKKLYDIAINGEQFRFAITKKNPPLYRKSLKSNSNWLPVSWMVHEQVDSLAYDETKKELHLFVGDRFYCSKDGGLRWNVPKINYAPIRNLTVATPFSNATDISEIWTLNVDIKGDVFFEDAAVDSFYKRPPYVSLQLVSSGYPCDGSAPVLSTNWERYLKGELSIPRDKVQRDKDYLLYIEVRDFQKNVQVGFSLVNLLKDRSMSISVSPDLCLPCFE